MLKYYVFFHTILNLMTKKCHFLRTRVNKKLNDFGPNSIKTALFAVIFNCSDDDDIEKKTIKR